MKKVLALVLLVASAAQANELKKAWNNFGKDCRVVSGGKALVAGCLAGVSAVLAAGQFLGGYDIATDNDFGWFELDEVVDLFSELIKIPTMKLEVVLRRAAGLSICSYATYLFSKQAWHEAKLALGSS